MYIIYIICRNNSTLKQAFSNFVALIIFASSINCQNDNWKKYTQLGHSKFENFFKMKKYCKIINSDTKTLKEEKKLKNKINNLTKDLLVSLPNNDINLRCMISSDKIKLIDKKSLKRQSQIMTMLEMKYCNQIRNKNFKVHKETLIFFQQMIYKEVESVQVFAIMKTLFVHFQN
ncbi:hypothetical protein RFI_10382 [Reticulomyxa filosa]|uniref:Uncharacterized protein n=1 Tax=Reticulomyxa filosa TaxID=46433 RepID=X6NL82_RETFI|nr:hypothetical protein RFI_10382 [Reticulomyxa filosa]|eukprot:ETO26751.1 hypothetical protein RFI_10382 [Reticulomyxa filosa]